MPIKLRVSMWFNWFVLPKASWENNEDVVCCSMLVGLHKPGDKMKRHINELSRKK